MFDNIGGKIKVVTVVFCILGMVGSVIGAIALWAVNSRYNNTIWLGLGVLVGGCAASWLGSLLTYGFGQSVENGEAIAERLRSIEQQGSRIERLLAAHQPAPAEVPEPAPAQRPASVPERQAPSADKWVCPACGTQNRVSVFCSGCGRYRKLKA